MYLFINLYVEGGHTHAPGTYLEVRGQCVEAHSSTMWLLAIELRPLGL